MFYKKHQVIKTYSICLDNNKPLYEIDGQFKKAAEIRPFLTSLKDAKEWLSEKLDNSSI
jgi:hypothetical protein